MAIELSKGKVLSVFTLVMINVIAVDSLRTLPFSAEYGFSLVFYYALAGMMFFIPTALVSAELATGWPETGGLYIWVREAFGQRIGFLAIWLQWIYNVVWYPTILAFIATTIAHIHTPELATNKTFLLTTIIGLFWLATLVNWFGIRISSFVSIFGAIVGTLIPMFFIMILGTIWLIKGNPAQIQMNWHSFFPDLQSLNKLGFFATVLFGLVGMEMSAVHAGDVKNPQHDYPRALLYSTMIILGTLVLSSLAIALVVAPDQLSLVSGLLDAFAIFFDKFHMPWMEPVIAVLIIIGTLSSVSAWIIGPTRGLYTAIDDSKHFAWLDYKNRYGAPSHILLLQGGIFMVLCSFFITMPSINSSYWILSAMTAQLALLVYLFMFSAAIVLRYKYPDHKRAYRIPGGMIGIYLVCGLGMLTCIAAIMLGFVPPGNIDVGPVWQFELKLVAGIVLLCLPPIVLTSKRFS